MTIEKSIDTVGMWNASCWLNKEFYVACSMNKVEALDRLFAKIYWKLGLVKPVQYPPKYDL